MYNQNHKKIFTFFIIFILSTFSFLGKLIHYWGRYIKIQYILK